MENKKRIAISIIGFIAVFLGAYFVSWLYNEINTIMSRTYSVTPVLILTPLIPVLFGAAIRVPALLRRWPEDRRFDTIRFGFQAVPGLSILAQPILSLVLSIPMLSPIFLRNAFVTFQVFGLGR